MRTKKEKRIPKWSLFILAAVLCAAAGVGIVVPAVFTNDSENQTVQKETEDEKKTILVWAWDNNFNVKAMKMAAEEYEKTHADIRITVISKERSEITAELANDFAAEAYSGIPDIVLIEDYQSQSLLNRYESEFYAFHETIDFAQYPDYKVSVSSVNDKHYGIPFDSGTAGLFYRKDVIERAGYTQEDMQNLTWDAYIEIGKKVKEITGEYMLTIDPSDLGIIRMMMQSAGKWYVAENGTDVDIAGNDALKSAIDIYEKLLDSGIACSVSDWNQFVRSFQTDQVATVVSGSWISSSIIANRSQSGLWRVAAVPRMEGTDSINASSIGGSSWYILKHGGANEEAVDFLTEMFVDNVDFYDTLIRDIRLSPAWKDAGAFDSYEIGDGFFGGQRVTRFFAQEAEMVPDVNYGSYTYEIEEILADELQNIMKQNQVDESLQKVQVKAEAIGSH